VILLAAATGGVILAYGFPKPLINTTFDSVVQVLLYLTYAADVWVGMRFGRLAMADRQPTWGEAAMDAMGVLGILGTAFGLPWAWVIFECILVLSLLWNLWQLNAAVSRRIAKPIVLLPAGFLGLIVVGTMLLKLPLAVMPGRSITWLDSLFTMTSAVCVTGLIVHDTATHFTAFGQTVIGVFIQLGGLGIIAFGSMFAMLLGSRISLREHMNLSEALNEQPISHVRRLVLFIIFSTLGLELIGALAMVPMWQGDLTFEQRLGHSFFHAVSAYCNAGFSTWSDSLISYRYSLVSHAVIAPLLVLGGLGFPVLQNLWTMACWHIRNGRLPWQRIVNNTNGGGIVASRLTMHTKIVLVTTFGLYLYGVVIIGAAQLMPNAADKLNMNVTANRTQPAELTFSRLGGVLADASFMSLTSRTAGFNTMPMEDIRPAGIFGIITLMIIGGSPGGTAGGMRTATFALLVLSIVATIRQRNDVESFGRRISDTLVRRAAAVVACYVLLIAIATLLLCLMEPYPFIKLLFEVTSAVTVTGLSMGITAELTAFGKWVIIVSMFLGRIGPLALLASMAFAIPPGHRYKLPAEDIMIG